MSNRDIVCEDPGLASASANGAVIDFAVVDAFTDGPFTGNPAGVVRFGEGSFPATSLLQTVARELNQPETAFLLPRDRRGYELRWFSPTVEVDLCGHATLASAHRVWQVDSAAPALLVFSTRGGRVTAERVDGMVVLDFPSLPAVDAEMPRDLPMILGVDVERFLRTERPSALGVNLVAVVADERRVRDLKPDLAAIAALPAGGLIVTAPADEGSDADFVSRYFAPAVGIPEDPVTGSAHCTLAPLWQPRFGSRMTGRQLSARGGRIRVQQDGDRVRLIGRARTTIVGTFFA